MADDDVGMSEERRSTAARLFDVRRVIGGLFVVYGVIVTVIGLFDTTEAPSRPTRPHRRVARLWTSAGAPAPAGVHDR